MGRRDQKRRCSGDVAWNKRLDLFTPILVRLLARHPRGHPLTTAEIADRSGLLPMQVETLSWATSWDGVDLPTFRSFTQACNLDILNAVQAKRNEAYLNGQTVNGVRQPPQFLYLKRDKNWETYYKPMMARYIESVRIRIRV